jgi:hypothetical protein
MSWKIAQQVEKDVEVICKMIKFRPILDKITKTLNGFIPIQPLLQVVIENNETQVKLKWSPKGGKNGKFTIQYPDKEIHKTIKMNGKVVFDVLSPKVKKSGERKQYASSTVFYNKLEQKVGKQLAEVIKDSFDQRMAEFQ